MRLMSKYILFNENFVFYKVRFFDILIVRIENIQIF